MIDVRDQDALLELETDEAIKQTPTLQNVQVNQGCMPLMLPRKHFDLLKYDVQANFLSWNHCPLCGLEIPVSKTSEFEAKLSAHVAEVHNITSDFRRQLLETIMHDFPTPITAQTHRSVLHRFRRALTEDAFTFAGCGCCTQRCQKHLMVSATFPAFGSDCLPEWLLAFWLEC